jgi:hypothetical protein
MFVLESEIQMAAAGPREIGYLTFDTYGGERAFKDRFDMPGQFTD